jgi:hypothetical protein
VIGTANFYSGTALNLHADHIMQGNGLIDRPQIMKAVWPLRTNAESKVDFGERSNRDGHGMLILRHGLLLLRIFAVRKNAAKQPGIAAEEA